MSCLATQCYSVVQTGLEKGHPLPSVLFGQIEESRFLAFGTKSKRANIPGTLVGYVVYAELICILSFSCYFSASIHIIFIRSVIGRTVT